ncbi:MAG: PAS domain-containing protein [Elusimicrobiota bacterium]
MFNKDRYKIILDNLTSGITTVDKNGNIVYINSMAGKILHLSTDIISKNYMDAFKNYTELCDLIYNMIKENKTVRRGEIVITHASILLKIGYSTMQVKDENGELLGYTIIFQDLNLVGKYDK